jgi:hypothetical protein
VAYIDPNKCPVFGSHRWKTVREYDKGGYHYEVQKCMCGKSGEKHIKKGRTQK